MAKLQITGNNFHDEPLLTARESKKDEEEERGELEDVHDHPGERDLQRPEVRVHAEDVDELQVGEDVGRGEEALRDQHRVPRIPVLAGQVGRLSALLLYLQRES